MKKIQKLAIEELKEESKKYTENSSYGINERWRYYQYSRYSSCKVSKLADKTQGVTLVKGRYEGIKKEGIYEYGDVIDYTVNISNEGTADLYDW